MLAKIIKLGKTLLRNLFWFSLVVLFAPRLITTLFAQSKLTTIENATPMGVAIVFGAGLQRDGQPAAVLRDRLDTAIELYQAGKVGGLLMSGHDPEPTVMRAYALQYGIPAEAIRLDHGGLRTYDTCYRAVDHFQLTEAILVTQSFHLPRALYICSVLGLETQGVAAQQSRYWRGAMVFWQLRETLATTVALWQVHITKPLPAVSQQIKEMELT